jgi:hypothetical protein
MTRTGKEGGEDMNHYQKCRMVAHRAPRLYRAGWDDCSIAEALEVTSSTIWRWRQRQGLPANSHPPAVAGYARARLADLHGKGLGDPEIGRLMGRTTGAVCKMRRRLGLPANLGAYGKRVRG